MATTRVYLVFLRCTFIVIWLSGIPRVLARTRRPAIIYHIPRGKWQDTCLASVLHLRELILYCVFLSWELLDNPSQSSLCNCCRSTCQSRSRRGVTWGIHPFQLSSLVRFLHWSLKKNHSNLFRFPKLRAQICVGTPDHSGSVRGPRPCAGHWSGVMLLCGSGDWN